MLTIGEIARLAGTSVRAVRHYHAIGLLPEPERDRSGYRRYRTADLVRLLRVRRLRELGLALDRIAALLAGPETELHEELDALDAELAAQAERIAEQRARLAQLRANPRPDLPERLGELFAEAAADGLPPRALAHEQEAVLLQLALHPERADAIVAEWERIYARLRTRPDQREIAARFDALADADADDPAVEDLARRLAEAFAPDDLVTPFDGPVPRLTELVFRDWGEALPPAQRRLVERLAELVG
jgi:DNA-binding transcriptional MerR regulator